MTKPDPESRASVVGLQIPNPPALPLINPASHPLHGELVTTLPHESPLIPNPGPGVLLSPRQPSHQPPNPLPTPTGPRALRRMQRRLRGLPRSYHSEGQPHRPRVVDDVSSHLGLQEGTLSQAPVLLSRDLLGHPRERDPSATESHAPLLATSKRVVASSRGYHVEGG